MHWFPWLPRYGIESFSNCTAQLAGQVSIELAPYPNFINQNVEMLPPRSSRRRVKSTGVAMCGFKKVNQCRIFWTNEVNIIGEKC